MQAWERDRFIEHFGADLVVLPGSEVAKRFGEYWSWRSQQTVDGGDIARREPPPPPELPPHFREFETVAVAYLEVDGLGFFMDYAMVAEAFENPAVAPQRRKLILAWLKDADLKPGIFRRLAEQDVAKADEVFERVLGKRGFSWREHGEDLLRRYKPEYFERPPLPAVLPASATLSELLGST